MKSQGVSEEGLFRCFLYLESDLPNVRARLFTSVFSSPVLHLSWPTVNKGPETPQSRLLHRSAGSSALGKSHKRSVIPAFSQPHGQGAMPRPLCCPATDPMGTSRALGVPRASGFVEEETLDDDDSTARQKKNWKRGSGDLRQPCEDWSVPAGDQRPHGLSEAIGASVMLVRQKKAESPLRISAASGSRHLEDQIPALWSGRVIRRASLARAWVQLWKGGVGLDGNFQCFQCALPWLGCCRDTANSKSFTFPARAIASATIAVLGTP